MGKIRVIHPFITTMTTIRSISTSNEFEKLAKENHLSWSEAARIGMSIMLSEIGIKDFDNSLNIVRRLTKFRQIAEEASQKVFELEERINHDNNKREKED